MTSATAELADRVEITDLISRYLGAIDDRQLDRTTLEGIFAEGGRLTRPRGASLIGPEEIATGQSESFARFMATHHVSSDHVVDLDGDSARIRANLIAMHLWAEQARDPNSLQTYFLAGGVLHALAVRTCRGWRLGELSLRNTWRTGTGYNSILDTGK